MKRQSIEVNNIGCLFPGHRFDSHHHVHNLTPSSGPHLGGAYMCSQNTPTRRKKWWETRRMKMILVASMRSQGRGGVWFFKLSKRRKGENLGHLPSESSCSWENRQRRGMTICSRTEARDSYNERKNGEDDIRPGKGQKKCSPVGLLGFCLFLFGLVLLCI